MAEIVRPKGEKFFIGRIPVHVTFDSARLLGPLQDVMRVCDGESSGSEPFHLQMRYGSEPSGWKVDELRLFWSGFLRGGIASEYYTAVGQRVVRVPGRAWGRLDVEQRSVDIVCLPGQEGYVYDGCLIPLLCELMAYHGHYVIHAASLALAGQGEMKGVLLSGVSGSGKTTTGLALAHAGMSLLTDDMSFIASGDHNGSSVGLWGLQLTCKIHDNTRRLLPWLDACPAKPSRVEGETGMDVTPAVGDSTGIVADPRLLLLLGPRSNGEHLLMPLDKTQAMVKLTSENIRAYEYAAESSPGNAFRALGQLVAQCDVYQLCVGNPLATLPDRIIGLLRDSQ